MSFPATPPALALAKTQAKRWKIHPPLPAEVGRALSQFSPILQQLLYNRGYTEPEQAHIFIEGAMPSDTDPMQMLGVPQAVERVRRAIQNGEKIAIYGDYDTDGVTATVLLVQTLEKLGGTVMGYIPDRFDEGYGLNKEALTKLHSQGVGLIITVDCGIRSPAEAEYARQTGLDLIISDHHHPAEKLPDAYAIINPKQAGDPYPHKELAGVGVAYKLAYALIRSFPSASIQPDELLDLVALGTVADLVPLVGENRALVRYGLMAIGKAHRQGLRSLIGAAGLRPERVTATDIGFALGPRLNAAGRIETAMAAYDLLRTPDVQKAGALAQQLDDQNRHRQNITRSMQAQAEQIVLEGKTELPFLLFAAHPDFNPGVVGLVASRLTEAYYRPAIAAHQDKESTRGSCRSIPEFHITNALDQCKDLLEHHGGHAAAAGFTVRNENLGQLIERLQTIAAEKLSTTDLQPTLRADMEIALDDLKLDLFQTIEKLQPTGYDNPIASFVSRQVKIIRPRLIGKDNSHLKFSVTDGRITHDAIAFRQGYRLSSLPSQVDLLYTFEINEYNGRESFQLNIKDIRY